MEKIYIKTHGCSNNFSESEAMAGILSKDGFEIVDGPSDADVIILNVCTVKGEVIALKSIRQVKEQYPYKKIVIAGCITPKLANEVKEIGPDMSLISTHNISNIRSVVEETMNDDPVEELSMNQNPKIGLPRKRRNPIVGIIPISSGCNQGCSYCSVILIKGKLLSYLEDKIIAEAKACLKEGCKELWITSQDTVNYGLDKEEKSRLPELIKKICELEGDFMIRLGMMNPTLLIPVADEMVSAFNNPKVFKFLHIPVQSGSDIILQKMNRKYTVEQFKELISKFRNAVNDLTISTDIIVGFPGETDMQFQESLALIKEIKPDVLNISRYIPRPGTKAYEMENPVDGNTAKERSITMTNTFDWIALDNNKKWKGWEGSIVVDEKGKKGTGTFVGRNLSYKPVVVEGEFNLGDKLKVKIVDTTTWDLRGQVVE